LLSFFRRKIKQYDDGLDLGDEAQEIERQSAQIRKELESEGWHSSEHLTTSSPHRSKTPTMNGSRTRSPNLQVCIRKYMFNTFYIEIIHML